MNWQRLKEKLDALYEHYKEERPIHTSALWIVHRYPGEHDQEVMGFIASSLAFGQVELIQRATLEVAEIMGPSPWQFLGSLQSPSDLFPFKAFQYRWVKGHEMISFLWALHRVLGEHGSLKALFLQGYQEAHEDIRPALIPFVKALRALGNGSVGRLLASVEKGSPCKRLNLFLRWMVREKDGIDFGLWKEVRPSQLIIPLDVHIARWSRHLGLTALTQPSWAVAKEITENLKKLDPLDPVKYDFAISRLGMKEKCSGLASPQRCQRCDIKGLCPLHDE